MKRTELSDALALHPNAFIRVTLPDGDQIPAHFHATEVGYVTKKFIDCGGVIGETETCVLQTCLGDDLDHRLRASTLGKILDLGKRVLPTHDLDVQIEYDCCVVGQYAIAKATAKGAHLEFTLENKRTQCRARERRNAQIERSCCSETLTCC